MMSRFSIVLLWISIAASTVSGDKRVVRVPANTLASLHLEAAEGSSIEWEARTPVPGQAFENDRTYVFFSGAGGRTLEIVSDVIDWDARQRVKTLWLVSVTRDDDDTPSPDPVPIVPNKHGVGKVAYDEARKVGNTAESIKLADIYDAAASQLAGLSGETIDVLNFTTEEIRKSTDAALGSRVGEWQGFRDAIKASLKATWRRDQSKETFVEVFAEIAAALRVAAE